MDRRGRLGRGVGRFATLGFVCEPPWPLRRQVQSRLLRDNIASSDATDLRKKSWCALAAERIAESIVRGASQAPLAESGRREDASAVVDEASIGYVFAAFHCASDAPPAPLG